MKGGNKKMEKKKRYDKKRKILGYDCDCGGFITFKKLVNRKKLSLFKEEITHLLECDKCKKTSEKKFVSKCNLLNFLNKKDLKERFIEDITSIGNNRELRVNYIKKLEKALLINFIGEFTEKERKVIDELLLKSK